mmetsp:Transcript_21350/g.63808  ORF Transcript_21350/g.63808 Transcript_21350/m.63808 type:complete len:235 (-) Transcript_21350:530-1234(-)
MVRRRLMRSCSVRSAIGPVVAPPAAAGASSSSSSSSSSESSSPRISRLISSQARSCSSKASSTLNTSRASSLSTLSSSPSSKVTWSSRSTRSSSSGTAGYSAKPALRAAKRPSMVYCTRLSMAPSCRMPRKRSKTASRPWGDTWSRSWPTSLVNCTAISTESSVGSSRSTVSSCSATSSCATWWFTRCARNLAKPVATTLSRRLYARRKPTMTRFNKSSPFSGSLVFKTATRAA